MLLYVTALSVHIQHCHKVSFLGQESVKTTRVSQKKRPAFERLLLPEYISNDISQYLIE